MVNENKHARHEGEAATVDDERPAKKQAQVTDLVSHATATTSVLKCLEDFDTCVEHSRQQFQQQGKEVAIDKAISAQVPDDSPEDDF